MYFSKIKTLYCLFTFFCLLFNIQMCQIILTDPILSLTLIGTTVHNLSTRVTKGIAALEKIIR